MPSTILPITIPDKQLPDPARRLSSGFVKSNGRPAGLWMSSKLAKAAADFSGNRNFGTLNGGVTTSGSGWGVLCSAWRFDGSTGYIPLSSQVTNIFTICAMITPTVTSAVQMIVCGDNDPSLIQRAFQFRINASNKAELICFNTSATPFTATGATTLVSGATYFITGTNDGSTAKVYVNGSLDGTAAITGTVYSGPDSAVIGARTASGSPANFYNGKLYIVPRFPASLSAAQISALYSSLLYGEPYRLFDQTANERFIGNVTATGGLLLARRRAAAA